MPGNGNAQVANNRVVGCAPARAPIAALLDEFRRDRAGGAWQHLPAGREAVAERIAKLVADADTLQQGRANLCGPAAFMRFWIRRDAASFARYAVDLFNTGRSRIGNLEVRAGSDLLRYALPATENIPRAADWILMASLRDSSNMFFDYQHAGEQAAAITTPGELAGWMSAAGVYESVRNEGKWFLTRTPEHAASLRPARHDTVVLINTLMLNHASRGPVLDAFPSHYVGLEADVAVRRLDGRETVVLSHWSWGEIRPAFAVPLDLFRRHYYGAIVGVPKMA